MDKSKTHIQWQTISNHKLIPGKICKYVLPKNNAGQTGSENPVVKNFIGVPDPHFSPVKGCH